MKKPLVSIIIPTKEEEENIENCLKSIENQNYRNTEIIIVDNFSKDKTLKTARKYAKKCFLWGKERSAQRNYGAIKSKGDFLLFLDADMMLTKKCISEALNKIQKNKSIIAFPEKAIGRNFWEKSIALERNLYQKEKSVAAARFFSKHLFLKVKGFNENLIAGEDWDLSERAEKEGYHIVFTGAKIIHQEKVKSLRKLLKKKNYYCSKINLYEKKNQINFKKRASILNRLLIFAKNWKPLIKDPAHTFGFLTLKTLVFLIWVLKKEKHKN